MAFYRYLPLLVTFAAGHGGEVCASSADACAEQSPSLLQVAAPVGRVAALEELAGGQRLQTDSPSVLARFDRQPLTFVRWGQCQQIRHERHCHGTAQVACLNRAKEACEADSECKAFATKIIHNLGPVHTIFLLYHDLDCVKDQSYSDVHWDLYLAKDLEIAGYDREPRMGVKWAPRHCHYESQAVKCGGTTATACLATVKQKCEDDSECKAFSIKLMNKPGPDRTWYLLYNDLDCVKDQFISDVHWDLYLAENDCCDENSARCLSCQVGLPEGAYCGLHPKTPGCVGSELLECSAPMLEFQGVNGACEEGPLISSGSQCTATCISGYTPSEASLSCSDGSLTPTTFTCEQLLHEPV